MNRILKAGFIWLAVVHGLAWAAEPPVLVGRPLIVRVPPQKGQDAEHSERSERSVAPANWSASSSEVCESTAKPRFLRWSWPTLELQDWCTPSTPAPCNPSWQASIDWLILQPRGNDFPYAVPACDCLTPDGTPGVLDMDYESGLRWTVSRTVKAGWFDVTGTHYLSETSNAIGTDADHVLRDLVLLSAPAGDINAAAARSELKFWTFDGQYRQCVLGGADWSLEGLLGFRIASLDQNAKLYFDDPDSVRIGTDIRGAGPRSGLRGTKYWGRCYAWGSFAATLLAAQADLDYIQHRPGAGFSVAEYHGEDDRLVPILDFELGLGYRITDNWSIAGGYLYSIWFNVVTPVAYTEALRAGDLYNDVDDTLSFDGAFLRLEYTR